MSVQTVFPSRSASASRPRPPSTLRATLRSALARFALQEDLNFLLTNRIPRQLATQFMGWFGRIEHPLVRDASIAIWRLFADPDLGEAAKSQFTSLQDCFTRALAPGARPIDPDPALLVSPCDAIVGACGPIAGTEVVQAKGFPYSLHDLLADAELVRLYRDGQYVTLRLTSSMYHRFHAPYDSHVEKVTYISGDTWNTNPIALARVERLFCKNERAVLRTRLDCDGDGDGDGSGKSNGQIVTMVAVASILVASLRLHCLDVLLHLRHRGPNVFACDAAFRKGEEVGWFELGSTIVVFAPRGFTLCDNVRSGAQIRMGQPLLRLP